MALALKKMDDFENAVSDEARTRIDYVRLRDTVFAIQKIVGGKLPEEDVTSLAQAIIDVTKRAENGRFTKDEVLAELRRTRSPQRAAQLADAIFK